MNSVAAHSVMQGRGSSERRLPSGPWPNNPSLPVEEIVLPPCGHVLPASQLHVL